MSAIVDELRIAALSSGAVQTTPTPCVPFGDIDSATAKPLLFARHATEDVVFPSGVGYTLAAHQLIRFEVHVVNGMPV